MGLFRATDLRFRSVEVKNELDEDYNPILFMSLVLSSLLKSLRRIWFRLNCTSC